MLQFFIHTQNNLYIIKYIIFYYSVSDKFVIQKININMN
uniref:Uncharacterized protein n=1 Tax=viral metagenome TaxID=1070528 RepID=A0A6C0AD29_9ZZZZ